MMKVLVAKLFEQEIRSARKEVDVTYPLHKGKELRSMIGTENQDPDVCFPMSKMFCLTLQAPHIPPFRRNLS